MRRGGETPGPTPTIRQLFYRPFDDVSESCLVVNESGQLITQPGESLDEGDYNNIAFIIRVNRTGDYFACDSWADATEWYQKISAVVAAWGYEAIAYGGGSYFDLTLPSKGGLDSITYEFRLNESQEQLVASPSISEY